MPIHVEANPLEQLGGPIMTMEYLANGTLGAFINRSQQLEYPLPNRLLWRLFGCCKLCRGADLRGWEARPS